MANLTAILLISSAMVIQNTIVTQFQLLYGAADLVMLVLLCWILQSDKGTYLWFGAFAGLLVGVSSAIPFWLPVFGYTFLVWGVTLVQRKVWQVPVWLLLISTFIGSLLIYGMEVIYLWLTGYPLDLVEVFNIILLPSLVLNMILVLPVFGVVGEVAKVVYPKEVEV